MHCYEHEAMRLQLISYLRTASPDASVPAADPLALDDALAEANLASIADLLSLSVTQRAALSRRIRDQFGQASTVKPGDAA